MALSPFFTLKLQSLTLHPIAMAWKIRTLPKKIETGISPVTANLAVSFYKVPRDRRMGHSLKQPENVCTSKASHTNRSHSKINKMVHCAFLV
jgi:hypothetical protein